jgi:predicted Zn-dependent protease
VFLALARVWLDAAEDHHDAASIHHAVQAVQVAGAQDNRSPEFLLVRGREQLLTGDAAGAERSLQAAASTLPAEPAVFRYLSQAATRLGHRDVARLAHARYVALTP